MSRRDDDRRLADIEAAIKAIDRHLTRGSIDDELVFDACRARLIEIGEAVKAIDPELLAQTPEVPWREIARMRDHLTHRYFDTQHEIVADVVTTDVPSLRQAISGLRRQLVDTKPARRRWIWTTRPPAPNDICAAGPPRSYRRVLSGPIRRACLCKPTDVRVSIGALVSAIGVVHAALLRASPQ